MSMKQRVGVVAIGGLAMTLSANPDARAGVMMLQMDLNSVVADAGEPFDGLTHTGQVTLSADANASLNSVQIDGDTQSLSAGLDQFNATLSLDAGQIVGGDVSILLTDGSMFVASLTPSSGEVDTQAGQGFVIDSALFAGTFDNLVGGSLFGGVDVSPWNNAEPLDGAARLFAFSPDGQGFDNNANFEVFIEVPSPGAVALPMGLALTAMRRRRRN